MKKEQKKSKEEQKENKDLKDVEEEIVIEQGKDMSELEKKAEEYLVGWKRCQADFENYKKMQSESQKDLVRYATQGILLEIIPVIDNFHASVAHIPKDQQDGGWVTGIMYIQKQLENVLAENGVEEIEVKKGDNFDPILHEAIEDKECKACKGDVKYENKVETVVLRGYKIGERVIRPARVIVR